MSQTPPPSEELPASAHAQLTHWLQKWAEGDRAALSAALPTIYGELRRLAHQQLRAQRANHTLQTTALINEAYLKLAELKGLAVHDRSHFIGIAGQLMRWIIVDYERGRRAAKRGGGATCVSLHPSMPAAPAAVQQLDVLMLEQALQELSRLDAQLGELVELRYFAGLSIEETAACMGVSPATVKRSWAAARAWLLRHISEVGEEGANA